MVYIVSISAEKVKQIAKIAKLEISDEELEIFVNKFNFTLAQVEKLKEVDTENVKPTTHVLQYGNVMREDIVKESLSQHDVLANAPEQANGGYLVPRVMEGA